MISKDLLFMVVASLLLMLAQSADAARISMAEKAYELSARDVIALSPGPDGVLLFKPCQDCRDLRNRTTKSTRYLLNGEEQTKKDFWRALRRSKGEVYVFVSLRTDRVTRIELSERP